MDPRFDQEKRDRARELYEAGASVRAVAEELGLTVSRTHTLLTEAGTEMRTQGQQRKETEDEETPESETTGG